MEKEISSGTMLGIVLIALAAVIGLGFGVFSIAKGVANEGTVNVQDNLSTVSESAFEDYNDKIVTGTMVKSAVTSFTGSSVAILINTTAMNKSVVTYASHGVANVYYVGAGGSSGDLGVDVFPYINYNALLMGESSNVSTTDGPTPNENGGYNYVGATEILAGTAVNGSVGQGLNSAAEGNEQGFAYIKDGILEINNGFAVSSATGKVVYDNIVGGYGRTGNCEYLASNAKFEANLIKDASGTTVGVIFTQMAV